MTELEKIITDDGTISFYNKDIGDIYHSKVGAYTEAIEKFIVPSKILEKLDNYSNIKVFDVCFGPGYNSKVLINSIFKIDPTKKISITAVEIDPYILLKSVEIEFAGYESNLKSFFDSFLHKVYYATISDQNSGVKNFRDQFNNLELTINVGDAREIVKQLDDSFDLIYLDPFSPSKLPELWTVDFFKHLYRLLKPSGVLVTYSSSFSVSGGLRQAGFNIGITQPVGRKSPGTIASKDPALIENPLTSYQLEMLDTTAGIPLEDPDLNWSSARILQERIIKQKQSKLRSASSVRKQNCPVNFNEKSEAQ